MLAAVGLGILAPSAQATETPWRLLTEAPRAVDEQGSCPETGFCVVVGGASELTYEQSSGWSQQQQIDPKRRALRTVSCHTKAFCMAIDRFGEDTVFKEGRWSSPPPLPATANSGTPTSVSCPTETF